MGDGDLRAGLPRVVGGSEARRAQRHGPEQRIFGNRIPRDELEWREIGSGMWARSFIGMKRMLTTTRSGPPEADVLRRIIRDVESGKVLDDCHPDNEADEKLFRHFDEKKNIRVELVMKTAAKWFKIGGPDVAEIYSPPRIVQEAGLRSYGGVKLKPGWSLDLTCNDPETGNPWDLSDGKVRTKVMGLIREGRPYMLICSPMCTAFSQIQALNVERRDPAVVRRELESAKDHVRWVMKLCAIQLRENRYFLFEHPKTATSWKMAEVLKVANMSGVDIVRMDMCRFGMMSKDEEGPGLVMKPTSMMTNSPEVAKRLSKRCSNRECKEGEQHRHVKLINGRASHV